MPPCALIWIWVTVTSGRHPMPARGCFMLRVVFKFVLAVICAGLLVPLAVACGGGEDGPPPTPFTGSWILEDETDPITDEGFISISLEASDDNASRGYNHNLIVQCHDGENFDVYVIWRGTLVATSKQSDRYINDQGVLQWETNSYVDVAWRVDDDDPQRDSWLLRNGNYTFAPSWRWYDTPAVDDLREADKIGVRVFSKSGGSQATGVFHTAGFEGAFEPIVNACK